MLNQVVLVGRLEKEIEIVEKGDKKQAIITLAIPRSYKNEEGIYETDFVTCNLWQGIAENTCEYCHKGDLVGIRGRMESNEIEKEDGTKEYKMQVVAEKVTFLSSKSKEINNENARNSEEI